MHMERQRRRKRRRKVTVKRSRKILLGIISVLSILLLATAIYANYLLDNFLLALNEPQLFPIELKDKGDLEQTEGMEASPNEVKDPKVGQGPDKTAEENNQDSSDLIIEPETDGQPGENPERKQPNQQENVNNAEILTAIQGQIGQPIEKMDILKAGAIILRKLSAKEINFLFSMSNKKSTKEELKKAREILFSKLDEDELNSLRALGQKYGKPLKILDGNIPID